MRIIGALIGTVLACLLLQATLYSQEQTQPSLTTNVSYISWDENGRSVRIGNQPSLTTNVSYSYVYPSALQSAKPLAIGIGVLPPAPASWVNYACANATKAEMPGYTGVIVCWTDGKAYFRIATLPETATAADIAEAILSHEFSKRAPQTACTTGSCCGGTGSCGMACGCGPQTGGMMGYQPMFGGGMMMGGSRCGPGGCK